MSGHLDSALEVWALIAINFMGFILGITITAVSYAAYRSHGRKSSLRTATAGFWFLTLGTAVEPIYQLGIVGTHVLASDQNLSLQILEGSLISIGFLLLFFSVFRYRSQTRRQTITVSGVDDDLFDGPE